MRLLYILVISISVISLTYVVQAYVTFEVNASQLTNSVALKNEAISSNLVQRLDIFIDKRIDDFRSLSKTNEIQQILQQSNEEFAKIEDVDSFLQEKQAYSPENFNRYLPFITQAVERKYSDDLNAILASYSQEFGYDYVDEFFITNAYGANIVLVFGKADYIQFDKPWWKSTKSEGTHIGDLAFQEKYNAHSLPLGVSITNQTEKFLGAIRVLVGRNDLLSDFETNANLLDKEGKQIILVDQDGRVIYSNSIMYDENEFLPYFDKLQGDVGNISINSEDESFVISYSKSAGYEDFGGLGWTVLVKQNEADIVAGLEDVRESILFPSIVGVGITVVIGVLISLFVSRPLNQITGIVSRLSKGEFDLKVSDSKVKEISIISNSINHMAKSLKKLVETEKELAETRVRVKNERLTAIGELAASMAHDMKNPLAIIKTSASLLERKLTETDEKTERILENMEIGISRMSHQIQDVLDYVRITPVNVKDSSLKSIINSAIESIKIPDHITINLPEFDATIQCDRHKMEILFINLILNATQAIGNNKGEITIQIEKMQDNFVITVQNSGDPIPDDVIGRIFDPLFTTKHQGTGLGLSTCKNVLEQHGGKIEVKNNPTRFVIIFPKEVRTKF